jgi:hypothetical protein
MENFREIFLKKKISSSFSRRIWFLKHNEYPGSSVSMLMKSIVGNFAEIFFSKKSPEIFLKQKILLLSIK